MQYVSKYDSPLGLIQMASDDKGLTGLWLEGQHFFAKTLGTDYEEKETFFHRKAKQWLDRYFKGEHLEIDIPIHFIGSDFQKEVWGMLCDIPYGQTTTYGEIAKQMALRRGLKSMSAQAVGGAVGHNPISIIVPCHRVIGANGNLTGYAGGIDKKIKLLSIEGVQLP